MGGDLNGGAESAGPYRQRRDARLPLNAEVVLRRSGSHAFHVQVFDISPNGCRVEFVERPQLDEHVWIRFQGLDSIEAMVCWIEGHVVGVEFVRPIHPAVFDGLVERLK